MVLQNVAVTISQLDSGGPCGVTTDCSDRVSLEEKSTTTTSNTATGEEDPDVTSLAECRPSSSSTTAEALALIQQISPLPKTNAVRKRARQVEGAEVVTGSPYKQRAMDRALKKATKSSGQSKNKAETKKKAEKKKKLTCRLDKPRGRKPTRTKTAEVGKRRVMKIKKSSVGEDPAKRPKKSEVNQNGKVKKALIMKLHAYTVVKNLVTVSVVNSGFSAAYAVAGAMWTAVVERRLTDLSVTFATKQHLGLLHSRLFETLF